MTSSSNTGFKGFPNIPAPPGSKSGASYARIIPAEELGDFAAWQPGAFGSPGGPRERRAQPRPEPSREPTPEQWRERIAEARKAGYQDGYRDGLVGLENFKQAHAAQMATQLGLLVQAFDRQWSALEPQMAQSLTTTALRLARRVLRQELRAQPEQIVSLAHEAVKGVMMSARRVEVHVHPDDLPLVSQGAGELLKARGARLVADAGIQRGGCLVQSDIASVDATLETRWAQAAAALGAELPLQDPGSADEGSGP
jgi:flagellar assembly protein FliH